MKSVDRLLAEHNRIERVLSLLAKVVTRSELGRPIPANFPQWAVRFFQQFADQRHHAKEEDVFFPLLKQRGIPEEGGPIGVMLHEHVLGRDCVGRMRAAGQASHFDSHTFTAAAKQYIPLLRNHIFKENNVLFRMAEGVISEADDAEVTSKFAQVEQARGLSGQHASYSQEASDWEKTLA